MGIDLKAGGRKKNHNKTETKSTNLYIHLLLRLYRFLERRTENSKFCRAITRRLAQSKIMRAPMSISRIALNLQGKEDKIAVLVGTVTNDNRVSVIPAMKICALKFTEVARARIIKAGGQCITFDELALIAPTGSNTLLLRGPRNRKAFKHWGRAPGLPKSNTKPYLQSSKATERGAKY